MAKDPEEIQCLIITRAFDECKLIPYLLRDKFAYWEFNLGGSTSEFAKRCARDLMPYWEFHKFDSSKDLPESAVDLASVIISMIGTSSYESMCRILDFLKLHITLNTIFIFEGWDGSTGKALGKFEEENPTVILKEIFDIYGYKAFQVRDL